MKESSLESCPVPVEQQPVNEYEQLKDSWYFRWATLDKVAYWKKLAWIWAWGWIVVGPIAAASFTPQKHPILFVLSGCMGTCLFVGLFWVQLYLGWYYIKDRLKSEKVFYEESGWYDGQIWQKPPEIIVRDRLIVSYQIEPIIKRLQNTALFLSIAIAIASCSIWLLLASAQ
jgi:Conserved in the green lineage and diatoms 27